MIPVMLFPLLETPLNKILQADPAVQSRLQALEGSTLALQILPFAKPLQFCVRSGQLQLSADEQAAAVQISGELQAFVEAQLNQGQIRPGALQISGDIAAAQRWQKLFADWQPDFEEQLSLYVGDIAAHEIGKLLRALQQWSRATLQHMASSAAQYAQEEAGWVLGGEELKGFSDAVDVLRDDAERLLARARQLGLH